MKYINIYMIILLIYVILYKKILKYVNVNNKGLFFYYIFLYFFIFVSKFFIFVFRFFIIIICNFNRYHLYYHLHR